MFQSVLDNRAPASGFADPQRFPEVIPGQGQFPDQVLQKALFEQVFSPGVAHRVGDGQVQAFCEPVRECFTLGGDDVKGLAGFLLRVARQRVQQGDQVSFRANRSQVAGDGDVLAAGILEGLGFVVYAQRQALFGVGAECGGDGP